MSRQEELDKLPDGALEDWRRVLVLSDAAESETEDDTVEPGGAENGGAGPEAPWRPSGLHAKIIAVEHGRQVTWHVGSANLTAAAFGGDNVEMMASVSGTASGQGIDRFLEGGFERLCTPYEPTKPTPEDPLLTDARARLEKARAALLKADLRLTCVSAGDDLWTLALEGGDVLPRDVETVAWPISIPEHQACPLEQPPGWHLPVASLTSFIAFRLSVPEDVDDIRIALRLPAEGMPEDRAHHVLRTLLDTPEKFLRFLRALLGGIEAIAGWVQGGGTGDGTARWRIGGSGGGETLLDDLLRTASRRPDALKPVRRLIDDLRKTEEGRRTVPDELLQLWTAVEEAVAGLPRERDT